MFQRRAFNEDVHILDLDLNTWLGQDQGFEPLREGGLKTEGTSPGVICMFCGIVCDWVVICDVFCDLLL